MKKVLVVVAIVALVAWVISWFRAPQAVSDAAARPWPGGMGTLHSAVDRASPLKANAASLKLAVLVKALPHTEAVDRYVSREIARGELPVGAPPALADVSAIREILLRETIVWSRRSEIGDEETMTARGVQMRAARLLLATALAKAHAQDAAAWDDLRALWNLSRSLDGHPQMMEQTAALSMVRMINAVAWKMPLPAPEWFRELQARDSVRPVLDAFQQQTASYWEDGARMFPTKWLADSVEHDRRIAEQVLNATACDVTLPMNELGTDVRSVWRRAFRYRAEREATANALRVRDGKPIETRSRCSDGAWTFDGTTLRFNREIATTPSDVAMPLVLRVAQKQ